jgi:glycyl-radical enzyme activating protein
MTGTVFDIQRFSVHDGPGIRTTVFFKGCNLRCFWCHNPESVGMKSEVQFIGSKCIGCGKCAAACPKGCHMVAPLRCDAMADGRRLYDRKACVACGACAAACPSGALDLVGKRYAVEDVLEIVSRDAPFYKNSGGGMTCSGGEPMLQIDFLEALLRGAGAMGIHTAVDTAGNVPFSSFERIIPHTNLFLYDIKCMDRAVHADATGTGNALILENIEKLSRAGAEIWVRVPVIPGVNDNMGNMERTADLLRGLSGVKLAELLTFHRLGGGKYESLGKAYEARNLEPAAKEKMRALAVPFTDNGVQVKIS